MVRTDAGSVHVAIDGPPEAPWVVLSPGLGGGWFDWELVVPLLADQVRVLRPDRPGIGRSEAALAEPTLAREVAVLHSVLDAVAGPGPGVLVGHSVAALQVEAFARLHPERVLAAVLVDPSTEPPGQPSEPDAGARVATALLATGRIGPLAALGRAASVQLGPLARRAVVRVGSRSRRDPLPAAAHEVYRRPTVIRALLAELAAYPAEVADLQRLRATAQLPAVPWVVLTAGDGLGDDRRGVLAAHAALAAMVPGGRHDTVAGAGHLLALDRPDAVAAAVLSVLD